HWRHATAVAMLVAIAACGSSSNAGRPSPASSPTPSASPSPSQGPCALGVQSGLPPLMAVLETRGTSPPGVIGLVRPFAAHDTLAIATVGATAKAKATFQPRPRPYVGNAATLLPPNEAYVVHGLVYYIDGSGSVWTMGADG